ncbi:hypothetical protein CRG98_038299, partial [Punica granatum]
MESPVSKGEESSKKVPATSSSSNGRREKEISVNAVNMAQQASQQYSMNFTAAPPVAPSYAPHAPQYRPQPLPNQSTIPHYRLHPHLRCHRLSSTIMPLLHPEPLNTNLRLLGLLSRHNEPRPRKVNRAVQRNHDPADNTRPCREGEGERGDPSPFAIEYVPTEATVGFARIGAPPAPFVINILVREPHFDDRVPWTYEEGVENLEQQFNVMGVTRSGRLYENLATTDKGKAPATEVETMPRAPSIPPKKVTEEEAEAFMKVIKASEYKVVEQMAKSPAHISLLALLLNSEPHREALLRVLTAAQVPKGTPPDRIEETINSIFSNTISFSDDELPSEGCAHSQALHIMNVDLNRVRSSKTAVRAFDGSRREVNGEIDLLIDIDPCSFSVTFQVLDIPNAFSLLLGRPWIHSAGAIPSSLHQKVKVIVEERIITVKGEEDYAIYKETAVPYINVGNDENLPFHSFETISVIRDYGEVLLRHNYVPDTGLGARGQGISRPIEVEEYKHRRGLGFRPSCHEIIEARRGNHLHRLAMHYECLGEPGPIYFGEGLDEDSLVPEIEESLYRLEDRQLTSLEPTEEINVGTEEEPRILKIGTSLNPTQRVRMIDFLSRYQEVFAWSYADMPGLDPSIAAIDFKVKELEMFGDSMLTIFQTLGQRKTKDAKLVPYHEYLEKLTENFEDISFTYTPRMTNQFADALATLASMMSITKENLIEPLGIEIAEGPAHCNSIEASEAKPWYEDIKNLLRTGQYPLFADPRDGKTLRRLAIHYFLSGVILYRRSFDSTLLRCIDEHESRRLMEEVHGGNCRPHMNGLMLAKKIMRLSYYWSTMETDCVKHVRHCHRCQ